MTLAYTTLSVLLAKIPKSGTLTLERILRSKKQTPRQTLTAADKSKKFERVIPCKSTEHAHMRRTSKSKSVVSWVFADVIPGWFLSEILVLA